MHHNNTNFDSEFNGGNPTQNDQMAFIDYEGDGLWMFGIATHNYEIQDFAISEIIDRDGDLNKLVKRAVMDWGVDPYELWVSPCGREIALLALNGKKIGD